MSEKVSVAMIAQIKSKAVQLAGLSSVDSPASCLRSNSEQILAK